MYNGLDWGDSKLRTLTAALAPAYIRIGGTAVDASFYFPDEPYNIGVPNPCDACGSGAAAIGDTMLDMISDFIGATGMQLLWDFDGERFRTASGAWDPTGNATALLAYLDTKHSGKVKYAFSVGNEPDLWQTKYPATTMASDAVTLKNVLQHYNVGKEVFGPSYARIDPTATADFLRVAAAGGVTGYTVHNCKRGVEADCVRFPSACAPCDARALIEPPHPPDPYGGHDCDVTKYLNKSKVTSDLSSKLAMVSATAATTPNGTEMLLVLEETAGSSGGGCDNVTDRFVAGFTWLLTLNTVAEAGFHRVHRQDIVGWSFAFGKSNYMLVGPPGWTNGSTLLTPHPDFYTTILFKQLIGRQVLHTSASGEARVLQNVSATAWCSGPKAPYGAGSVVLVWLNLSPSDVTFTLPASLATLPSTRFTLTGSASGTDFAALQSDDIFLNGVRMTVNDAGALPVYPIPGASTRAAAPLVAGAYSYGFVAFEGAAFAACAA